MRWVVVPRASCARAHAAGYGHRINSFPSCGLFSRFAPAPPRFARAAGLSVWLVGLVRHFSRCTGMGLLVRSYRRAGWIWHSWPIPSSGHLPDWRNTVIRDLDDAFAACSSKFFSFSVMVLPPFLCALCCTGVSVLWWLIVMYGMDGEHRFLKSDDRVCHS